MFFKQNGLLEVISIAGSVSTRTTLFFPSFHLFIHSANTECYPGVSYKIPSCLTHTRILIFPFSIGGVMHLASLKLTLC